MKKKLPIILSFDTSGAYCAAALCRGHTVLSCRVEYMKRGQAERLIPLLQEILDDAVLEWTHLDAIGVGVGPGNFTGIRISVSTARGLALGLKIPAVGVSTFEAVSLDIPSPHVPAVPAPRDHLYVLPQASEAPLLVAANFVSDLPVHLPPSADTLVTNMAKVAALRHENITKPPVPLYIKPADAAPSRDLAPIILE
ncbi:tRNA (adenosine(37)-N6)-threonylcarbamoyltransferase complex dimerization subunit type 1 TsaB [Pseudopelagicola sp. nBUS_19]|uniref:tRNA (adenosine(37)-N6)-threonylcarbamoyltransferase complex dimerization subunit type 1 TsaB n=1 Tax=Pseudopelagicola sp. nBUS_19 TaxID=3395316 RepID=UPI003EBDF1A8